MDIKSAAARGMIYFGPDRRCVYYANGRINVDCDLMVALNAIWQALSKQRRTRFSISGASEMDERSAPSRMPRRTAETACNLMKAQIKN